MFRAAEPKDETPGGVPFYDWRITRHREWPYFVVTSLYRHSSHNPEFHNVNCRSCGAIHNVDRACISVLSQVIRNVNKRKTVWTNIIFFVSYGDRILTTLGSHCFSRLLFRSLSEYPANRNIIFRLYRFSFHKPIKSRLVRGRLYLPLHTLRKHHKICCSTVSETPVIKTKSCERKQKLL